MNSQDIFERLAAHLIATESSIGEVTLDIKTMAEERPVFEIRYLEDGIVKVKLINNKTK